MYFVLRKAERKTPLQKGAKIKRRFAAIKRRFIFGRSLFLIINSLQRQSLLLVVVFSFDFFSHFFGNNVAYRLVFYHTLANIG